MAKQPPFIDDDAGPLVRPYALTAGRGGTPREELDLITTLVAARPASASDDEMGSECSRIIGMCQRPLSVAEVSSQLKLPVGIVRVLLSDLLQRGLLHKRSPSQGTASPSHEVFRAVINGLRSL
ncbi:MAG TPA: DUF742 domain-containing protein [Candidatus Limnocylindrales bacterium]